MSVSVSHLSFLYEKTDLILNDISFTVDAGRFLGIFGPNGGGKTTLLKLLLGLFTPTKGEILIAGKPPKAISNEIGYVPQLRRFDKQFPISVFDVVIQGCLGTFRGFGDFSKEAKQRAMEALEKVGLQDKAKQPFGTLSGGQIQRTLIARALASNPKILLLDEATVGIDPEALKEVFDFLLTLKGNITIMLVTHQLQAIAKEMDSLLCINRDLTVFSPQQVCEHFAMGLYHPPLMKKKEQQNHD